MIRRLLVLFVLALATLGAAVGQTQLTRTLQLLSARTTTGAGTAVQNVSGTKTYEAYGTTSAGAGASVILVQGSNDGTVWGTTCTITLVLATTASGDSCTSQDRYGQIRANVSSISGTGATVSVSAGF